jgi:glycosyltransferase involved in cell wall biosynthesis
VGPVPISIGSMLHTNRDLAAAVDGAVARADVVHIHALWESIQHVGPVTARRRVKPYIFRPCGMLDPWSLAQRRLKKNLYLALRGRRDLDEAAALHFTSDLERDFTSPLKLKPRAIVEPNGVPVEEFEHLPQRGMFRQKYPELADKPLLIFLSRIHHKKGLDLLVPALAKLRHRDAMLAIVGPDSDGYGQTVREMIEAAGVRDRVVFAGMLRGADRISALVDADLFVLPSYQENFGIAVVEALAAGTPVVISDQVNIYREIAAAQVGGVVPTKVEPLAAEIDRWLGDEPLRRTAAERARPFVWEHYDWNRIARRWVEHYQTIVATAAAPRS